MKDVRIGVGTNANGVKKATLLSYHGKKGENPVKPTPIQNKETLLTEVGEWISWGDNDDYPQMIDNQLGKSTVALPIIGKHVAMMYGQGIYYYKKSYDANNNEVRTKVIIPEIEEFLRKTNVAYYLQGILLDYKRCFNCFTSVMFNNAKTKVDRLVHRPAKTCRIGKPNERLETNWIYMAWDFPNPSVTDKIRKVNEYDPYGSIEKLSGKREMILHHHYNTGNQYYAKPFHSALFEKDSWLDVGINTPKSINALQRNLLSIKYIIRIPITYFQNRYKDWDSLEQDAQLKIIDDKITEMNESLSGNDNLYKSIADVYGVNDLGEAEPQIEVEAVDDKTKTDQWIPSSDAADKQVAYALMMNPSQVGMGDASKIGAGSGSDIREGFNGIVDTNTIEQQTPLVAFYFASMVNGWDVHWAFEHTKHVTTDISKTGKENENG